MAFALFKGTQYYPWGGAEDFFEFAAELPTEVTITVWEIDWVNALDLETGVILEWKDNKWQTVNTLQHERKD